MEDDLINVYARNSSVPDDYGDGALVAVMRQLRWNLKRLSDLPAVDVGRGEGNRYHNGLPIVSGNFLEADVTDLGACDDTSQSAQLRAAEDLCRRTVAAASASKPEGPATLAVGPVGLIADITERGLYMRLSAEFRWLLSEQAS